MNNDATQDYLSEHPWFEEPYQALKRSFSDGQSVAVKSGLTDAQLREAKGDFDTGNAYAYPETYFDFLRLVGGFDCCDVHLYSGYFRAHKYEEFSYGYVTMNTERSSKHRRNVQYILGECDHGLYIFDARDNTYYLEGFGRETHFTDCIGMLLHAIWRAREMKQMEQLHAQPWFWEPFEAAKQLERDIPERVLWPGLSDAAVADLDANIPRGDAPPWGGRVNAYQTPTTYLEFSKLVGGLGNNLIWLGWGPFSVYDWASERRQAPTMGSMITYEVSFPMRIKLGHCDHGYYLFDTRWNNYLLLGWERTTYFDDCIGMLLHAIWRIRETSEGR